jgi:hypothetical protein
LEVELGTAEPCSLEELGELFWAGIGDEGGRIWLLSYPVELGEFKNDDTGTGGFIEINEFEEDDEGDTEDPVGRPAVELFAKEFPIEAVFPVGEEEGKVLVELVDPENVLIDVEEGVKTEELLLIVFDPPKVFPGDGVGNEEELVPNVFEADEVFPFGNIDEV